MEVLLLLIPLSVLLVILIGALFWWSVENGQFDDLDGPAHRILADDDTSDVVASASPRPRSPPAQGADLTFVKPASDASP